MYKEEKRARIPHKDERKKKKTLKFEMQANSPNSILNAKKKVVFVYAHFTWKITNLILQKLYFQNKTKYSWSGFCNWTPALKMSDDNLILEWLVITFHTRYLFT